MKCLKTEKHLGLHYYREFWWLWKYTSFFHFPISSFLGSVTESRKFCFSFLNISLHSIIFLKPLLFLDILVFVIATDSWVGRMVNWIICLVFPSCLCVEIFWLFSRELNWFQLLYFSDAGLCQAHPDQRTLRRFISSRTCDRTIQGMEGILQAKSSVPL